ncbi:MAG: alkaline phosphatase family protein [Armatimonadetes bacterium]|nr:alkaline phosphatase family protein [Armatimonadota bacterium]
MPNSKHVIIFGMDGCRPDALVEAKTPHIDRLIREGAFAPTAQTGVITISGPGWSDMLTGVWGAKHGVTDNSFEGANYEQYPHLFQRLKEKNPSLVTASIVNWKPINEQILRSADHAVGTGSDAKVCEETVRYLQSATPNVTFLQLDDVDAAGHKHRYAPDVQGYLDSIAWNDSLIGEIWGAILARTNYAEEDWLILVSTDHGGTEYGHGQNIPEHRTIFVIAHYSDGTHLEFPAEVNIVDIPVLVARHLGVEIDPDWNWDGNLAIA